MKNCALSLTLMLSALVPTLHGQSAGEQSEAVNSTRKVLTRVLPAYSQLARSMNLSGTVKLDVMVRADGTVKSVEIRGGHPLLADLAQNAAHAWKWQKSDHDTTESIEFHFHQ